LVHDVCVKLSRFDELSTCTSLSDPHVWQNELKVLVKLGVSPDTGILWLTL